MKKSKKQDTENKSRQIWKQYATRSKSVLFEACKTGELNIFIRQCNKHILFHPGGHASKTHIPFPHPQWQTNNKLLKKIWNSVEKNSTSNKHKHDFIEHCYDKECS